MDLKTPLSFQIHPDMILSPYQGDVVLYLKGINDPVEKKKESLILQALVIEFNH